MKKLIALLVYPILFFGGILTVWLAVAFLFQRFDLNFYGIATTFGLLGGIPAMIAAFLVRKEFASAWRNKQRRGLYKSLGKGIAWAYVILLNSRDIPPKPSMTLGSSLTELLF